jgi:hypothetical protein
MEQFELDILKIIYGLTAFDNVTVDKVYVTKSFDDTISCLVYAKKYCFDPVDSITINQKVF